MAELSIEGLTKGFGDASILRGVDLRVPDLGFCVLLGPSGCGKSTLLRCIAGLEEPDQGSVRIGGVDVTRLSPRERDIAMVFQSYALYPHLSVRENLAFGLSLRKTPRDEIARRVAEAAELLGLSPLLDRLPRQLSGGQRQRVAMGRAIVRRPRLFLFDEPLSNLDAALRAEVRVEIRRLHDRLQATSVYVTHDQIEAMTLADVMVVLNRGRIEQAGAPLEIYDRPATRFVAGFLGSPTMSFVKATFDGGAVLLGGARLPVSGFHGAGAREIELGARAEDVSLRDDSPLRVRLEVVEALGSETFAHGAAPWGRLVMKLPPRAPARVGDEVGVHLDPARLHLFDAEGGASLRA
ncbi:MAG: sn-glycerol-3-phosphate ABC transporter ATP-binding protein UgpC [Polyangiaceae bacterium]|nr:sn-glycerol-3-phosphate ABC transporter ATP-binding protein UgpC [Polyangiaceae bacterium]